jgi:hypothetical protein
MIYVRIPLAPPLDLSKPISAARLSRIFSLFRRVIRGGLNTIREAKSPNPLSDAGYSPKLMTAPFRCSACKALNWNGFATAGFQ